MRGLAQSRYQPAFSGLREHLGMRDYLKEFPHLNHLIGGYFHQDWMTDGNTWEDVVEFFCRM